MTIQTKTTLLFTILTLTVFLVLTATVYYFSNQFAYNDFYKRLELRARIASKFNFEKDHTDTKTFKEIQTQYLEKLADEKTHIVKLSKSGKPLPTFPQELPLSYLNDIRAAKGSTVYYNDNLVHYAGIFYKDETGDFLVIESATNSYGAEIIARLRSILIITLICSIALIYSVGMYFSRSTFRPFLDVTEKVKKISEGNLQLRLDETQASDEMAVLINTFNQMLDRLQTAFESQNNFVSNASHELRTPLTAIVAETDYALSKERSTEDYRQSLQHIMQQSEKLQHLTKGLLSLAQTGFDGSKQQWENIRIDQLLFDVKDNVTEIFPQSKITIRLDHLPDNTDGIIVCGNEDLLKIAIGNIVLNACKYSDNKPVDAALAVHNKQVMIKITDQGIGIPEEEIQNIKNPFFRASNTSGFEGHGIGLPLSNNIIKMHKGTIAVHSKIKQGTEVIIILPLSQPQVSL